MGGSTKTAGWVLSASGSTISPRWTCLRTARRGWSGTPEDWATESLLAAREAYQDPQSGKRIKSGTKLGDAYQAKNLPVARKRLAQAGLRLAWVLNRAFTEN
jgi:S1/P1 Nuclease